MISIYYYCVHDNIFCIIGIISKSLQSDMPNMES